MVACYVTDGGFKGAICCFEEAKGGNGSVGEEESEEKCSH